MFNSLLYSQGDRDVNFGFFPKIDYRFEKNWFFLIIEFGRRSPWVTLKRWNAVTDAVVACPPGVALPLATATAGNNPESRIGQVLHVLVIA